MLRVCMQTSDLKATGDMSLDVVFDTVASRMRQKPGELGCVGGVFKADHLHTFQQSLQELNLP
jgi:hypothetical protein